MNELALKRSCMNTFSDLVDNLKTMEQRELSVLQKYVDDFKPMSHEVEYIKDFENLKNQMRVNVITLTKKLTNL